MTSWKTETELAEDYLVGVDRLRAYARRGNLAARWLEDGTTLFDEAGVARLFRDRHAPASLGVLGVVRVGEAAAASSAAPPQTTRRHRAPRPGAEPMFPGVTPDLRRVG